MEEMEQNKGEHRAEIVHAESLQQTKQYAIMDVQLMYLVHFRWILMHSSKQYIFHSAKMDQL